MQADANKLNELMKKDQQETSEKQRVFFLYVHYNRNKKKY